MAFDIGPNLLAILGPIVTVGVLWAKSTIEARKASAERQETVKVVAAQTAAVAAQTETIGQIHEATNAAVNHLAEAKDAISGMLKANNPK